MSSRPNILFFFPDEWRRDWTGLEDGVGIETPNLRALAGDGLRYTNAWCPSPLCAPSRACLASGRGYHRAGVRSNGDNYPASIPTFYAMLRDSGYTVLGCGKFDLHKPEYTWGPDGKHGIHEWGFSDGIDSEGKIDGIAAFQEGTPGPYLGYLEQRGRAADYVRNMRERKGPDAANLSVLSDEEYGDNWVARNGLELLEKADKDKPWFLQVNFTGPHPPFDITERMAAWYKSKGLPAADGPDIQTGNMDSSVVMELRRNYAAMCQNIDEQIGHCLGYLERTGQRENTVIVFSSDHGEMLGDRNLWGKCVPYTPSLGVPLILSGPGIPKATVDGPTSALDLAATFLAIAGLPVPEEMDSRPLWKSSRSGKTELLGRPLITAALEYSDYNWRAVVDDRYKLIQNGDGRLELYDYRRDPGERTDIAAENQSIVEKLSRAW